MSKLMSPDHRCQPVCPVCAFDARLNDHYATCSACEDEGLCQVASAMIDQHAKETQPGLANADWEDDCA